MGPKSYGAPYRAAASTSGTWVRMSPPKARVRTTSGGAVVVVEVAVPDEPDVEVGSGDRSAGGAAARSPPPHAPRTSTAATTTPAPRCAPVEGTLRRRRPGRG